MRQACSLGMVAVAACVAAGQTALPEFYFFQNVRAQSQIRTQPPLFGGDRHMTGMVVVNTASGSVDDNPINAADKVMDFIRGRLADQTLGYLDPTDIPVSLPGFAHANKVELAENAPLSAMRDPTDPIRARPGQTLVWPTGFSTDPLSADWWNFALLHPWMTASRPRLTGWMQTFMSRIMYRHERDHIPLPKRYMFDSEQPIFGCCEQAWSYSLLNVMKDARWNTAAVAGYYPQRTMAQLYAQATAHYGWDLKNGDGTPLNPGFNPAAGGPQELPNRPLSQWYTTTVKRIRSGIMRDVAYEPIRAAYAAYRSSHPNEIVPLPVIANYGEYMVDGEPDVFGWFQDKFVHLIQDPTRQAPEPQTYDYETVVHRRLSIDTDNEGARQGHTMVADFGGFIDAFERWAMIPTMTWADRDAVPLYDWRISAHPAYTHIQNNLYRYDRPLETPWDACMRLHRHRVESVLNSVSPEHRPNLLPYIRVPGEMGDYGVPITEAGTRELLAMLRAKGVTEIVPFTSNPPDENTEVWRSIQRLYRQVWAYQVQKFRWSVGSGVTTTKNYPADLFDTLRVPSRVAGQPPVESVTTAQSRFDGVFTASTQLETTFVPLLTTVTGDSIRINIECQAAEGPFGSGLLSLVEGGVYLWDFTLRTPGLHWRQLNIGEGDRDPAAYIFATQDDTTRRTFDIANAAPFIGPGGIIRVMLRHNAPAEFAFEGFESRYDLVQVILLNDRPRFAISTASRPAPGGDTRNLVEVLPEPTGADLNFDHVVDEADLVLFVKGLLADDAPADVDDDPDSFVNAWTAAR
ncbi:MAG: hypothetical protein JSR77_01880 [Planctomycetes bacterium]|nr:hypothetical protein [Planctomycetota bacterium]